MVAPKTHLFRSSTARGESTSICGKTHFDESRFVEEKEHVSCSHCLAIMERAAAEAPAAEPAEPRTMTRADLGVVIVGRFGQPTSYLVDDVLSFFARTAGLDPRAAAYSLDECTALAKAMAA